MGLLAYHPERLSALLSELLAAEIELRCLRADDPLAARAMVVVGTTRWQLASDWLPLTRAVLTLPALTVGQQHARGIDDLRNSLVAVMTRGYGWSAQADPRDVTLAMTPEMARALGARLAGLDATAARALAEDAEALDWLAAQLRQIAADPALAAAFRANFTDWSSLAEWLAWSTLAHAGSDRDDRTVATAVRGVVAQLGAIAGDDLPPGFAAMRPYTAAMFVPFLDLGDADLADLCLDLLRQWQAQPATRGDGPWTDTDFAGGPNTADVLFAVLVQHPVAARRFAVGAADEPALLFASAGDEGLAHLLLLVATDPATCDPSVAAAILLPLLRTLADDTMSFDTTLPDLDRGWHEFLGQLVAPWLLDFGGISSAWPFADGEREHLLAFVCGDPDALRALLLAAGELVDVVARRLAEGTASTADVAATLALVLQLGVNEAITDAEARAARHETVWGLAGLLVGAAGGTASDIAMFAASSLTDAPDVAAAADGAERERAWVLTVVAAAVATATYRGLVAGGRLPDGVPPPPPPDGDAAVPDATFLADYREWLQANGLDGTAAGAAMDAAVLQFVNGASTGEHRGELA